MRQAQPRRDAKSQNRRQDNGRTTRRLGQRLPIPHHLLRLRSAAEEHPDPPTSRPRSLSLRQSARRLRRRSIDPGRRGTRLVRNASLRTRRRSTMVSRVKSRAPSVTLKRRPLERSLTTTGVCPCSMSATLPRTPNSIRDTQRTVLRRTACPRRSRRDLRCRLQSRAFLHRTHP